MKNNFLKQRLFFFSLLCSILILSPVVSKELKIKATEIQTFEKGNIIIGKDKAEAKIIGELEIFAEKFTYDKEKEFLIAEDKVVVFDLINKIIINSNKIEYYKSKNEIISYGKTNFNIKDKYKIISSDIFFDNNKLIIFSDNKTFVEDDLDNKVELSSFKYFDKTEILNGKDIKLTDNEQNKYFLSQGKLNLKDYALLGKDIKILLRNDTFGIQENEPKLKGNSLYYHNDKSLITKGIFTSCKENNNCPP